VKLPWLLQNSCTGHTRDKRAHPASGNATSELFSNAGQLANSASRANSRLLQQPLRLAGPTNRWRLSR